MICDSEYRVVNGDTLYGIALRAYGNANYFPIFAANRDRLTNASRIYVGNKLIIPCLDEAAPDDAAPGDAAPALIAQALLEPTGTTAATAVARFPPATDIALGLPPPDGRGVVFVVGADFAPFADPALPEGGMITEMARLAMAQAAPGEPVTVALVEDWSTHLNLLEQGRFDMGFPWYRPDCARAGKLDASMRRRCADFEFSNPLFEIAVAYYVRAGDPLGGASGYDQLSGRGLCRPADHFTFDLAQEGLVEPAVTLVHAPHAADCLTLLAEGKVDVASIAKPLAEPALTRLGFARQVAEIPALVSVQTLHVVAPKHNARALAYLTLVNTGLQELHETGRWFEIVSRHFGDFGIRIF